MSHDTDFRAVLIANAGLTALVGARIAVNAVPQGSVYPLVVFVSSDNREYGLDNTLHGTEVTYDVQCYGKNTAEAAAVADEVEEAIAASSMYVVTSRASAFDEELDLDAETLTVSRWIT